MEATLWEPREQFMEPTPSGDCCHIRKSMHLHSCFPLEFWTIWDRKWNQTSGEQDVSLIIDRAMGEGVETWEEWDIQYLTTGLNRFISIKGSAGKPQAPALLQWQSLHHLPQDQEQPKKHMPCASKQTPIKKREEVSCKCPVQYPKLPTQTRYYLPEKERVRQHEWMSSTGKLQEWGISAFQQLPQIFGRNMRILCFHKADRELSVSLRSTLVRWWCSFGIMLQKEWRTLNLGHFVMTSDGHNLMSGSWEVIRRQLEKDDIFCLFMKRKKKAASDLDQSVLVTTPDASCPKMTGKEYSFFLWVGPVEEKIYPQRSLIWTARSPMKRSNPTSLSSNGSRMLLRSSGGKAPVTRQREISCSERCMLLYRKWA